MYSIMRRIATSDVGRDSRLTLGALVRLMQDCSCFQLDSEGVLSAFFKKEHCGMYLAYRQIDIDRLPAYGEDVTIETRVLECNRAFGMRNTCLYDKAGAMLIKSNAVGVFCDLETGRPMRLDQSIIDTVPFDKRVEMEYLPRKIKLPEGGGERREALVVKKRHIDYFGHMNNAAYVEEAWEFAPAGFEAGRIRVEYIAPIKEGELVIPCTYREPEGKLIVAFKDGDEKARAIVEFWKKSEVGNK